MSITVTIDPFRIMREAPPQCPLDEWTKMVVLLELRRQGAPVTGTLLPELMSGVLTRVEDYANNLIRFHWRESNESVRVRPD